MLPPETTATGVVASGSSSRWYSHAATAAAPPGSATSRAWRREQPDRGEHLVLGYRDHVGHQLADVRERQRADLFHPERVRDRALDVGRGPADPLTAAEGLAGVRGEFRLDAHHGRGRASGPHGRRDARDQATAADRHQDQADLRVVGRDLQADRALAGDDRPVVEGRDQHVTVPGRSVPRWRLLAPPRSAPP